MRVNLIILVFLQAICISLLGQQTINKEIYLQDELGNILNRREGVLDGNNVRSIFNNNGEIGQWPFQPSGEWPKGTGQSYLDGMYFLVTSKIKAPGTGTDITPFQCAYREHTDFDKVTGLNWTLEPLPGYADINSETPAIFNAEESYPETWPVALGLDNNQNGKWYSIYKYIYSKPSFESFYVMDDSKDGEYAREPYAFYPVASDSSRKGLGLRIEAGLAQFDHRYIDDVVFLTYDVFNLSDFDYPSTIVGFYVDPGVGGTDDSGDDNAYYDLQQNMTYSFDTDGRGIPGGYQTGYIGFGFLKTPSSSLNGIDDDNDSIIDERQNDGIDNDNDWIPFTDSNQNGVWDNNEPLNDDLGADGLGPGEAGYAGPDNGEGDGMPTLGEPNFEFRDNDEADQVGLGSLSVYRLGDGGTGGGWPKDDEAMWLRVTEGNFDTEIQNSNISMVFGSGKFSLGNGVKERVTGSLIFGDNLNNLIYNKVSAQSVYDDEFKLNSDKINVDLIQPADGVELSGVVNVEWAVEAFQSDEIVSDIFLSRDGENFEYLATVNSVENGVYELDTRELTDGIFYKLKIQCNNGQEFGEAISSDYFTINNEGNAAPEIKIISPVYNEIQDNVEIEWLAGDADGDDVSVNIFHSYSFDGDRLLLFSSNDNSTNRFEWNCKLFRNSFTNYLFGEVISGSDSTLVYWGPFTINNSRQTFAGEELLTSWNSAATGTFNVSVINTAQQKESQYKIEFNSIEGEIADSYNIYNATTQNELATNVMLTEQPEESPEFDGISIMIFNDSQEAVIDSLTGWVSGNCNLSMNVALDHSAPARDIFSPYDYELIWFDHQVETTPFFNTPINFKTINATRGDTVEAEVFDNNSSGSLDIGDDIIIIERVETGDFRITWRINYGPPENNDSPVYPSEGDRFRITPHKPFMDGESFVFSTASITGVEKGETSNPDAFKLFNNYPNPFNPSTTIEYSIPIDKSNPLTYVSLKVFDLLGRDIKTLVNSRQKPGRYKVKFDSDGISSGVYFYKLTAGGKTKIRKMILVK